MRLFDDELNIGECALSCVRNEFDIIDEYFYFSSIFFAFNFDGSGENDGGLVGEFFGTDAHECFFKTYKRNLSVEVFEETGSHFGTGFCGSDGCIFEESAKRHGDAFSFIGKMYKRGSIVRGEAFAFLSIVVEGVSGDEVSDESEFVFEDFFFGPWCGGDVGVGEYGGGGGGGREERE